MELVQQKFGMIFRVAGNYKLPGGLVFAPSYLQAGLMVLMIFLLILTLGQLRKRFLGWHISGIMPGLTFGFAIALILEGILVIGGRTIVTELLGWKSAPKPLVKVLDAGRARAVTVLGVTDPVPVSNAMGQSKELIISSFENLNDSQQEEIRQVICISE